MKHIISVNQVTTQTINKKEGYSCIQWTEIVSRAHTHTHNCHWGFYFAYRYVSLNNGEAQERNNKFSIREADH